jgi:hypothetical protein
MEHTVNDTEIENLTLDLSVAMDKIKFIDGVLKYCPDPDTFDKYVNKFDIEVDKMFEIKSKLTKLLSARIDLEKSENLPINMAYRLLYKELGKF